MDLWNNENRTVADLQGIKAAIPIQKFSKEVDLIPGASATIFETLKGGRITGIECSPATCI